MATPVADSVASSAAQSTSIQVPTLDVIRAVTANQLESAKDASQAAAQASLQFHVFGYNVNLLALLIALVLFGILWMFYSIQKSNKLDFADMITRDGRSVSMTKILQLLGAVTSTWIMIKLTLTNGLTESLFGIYLAYVAGVEGYSKFVAAKYGYQETSVRDGGVDAGQNGAGSKDPDGSAAKIINSAINSATDAESSARDAKVQAKNAAIDLQENKDN